jgi:hypothetical protein
MPCRSSHALRINSVVDFKIVTHSQFIERIFAALLNVDNCVHVKAVFIIT